MALARDYDDELKTIKELLPNIFFHDKEINLKEDISTKINKDDEPIKKLLEDYLGNADYNTLNSNIKTIVDKIKQFDIDIKIKSNAIKLENDRTKKDKLINERKKLYEDFSKENLNFIKELTVLYSKLIKKLKDDFNNDKSIKENKLCGQTYEELYAKPCDKFPDIKPGINKSFQSMIDEVKKVIHTDELDISSFKNLYNNNTHELLTVIDNDDYKKKNNEIKEYLNIALY
jgi:hypothetical protein